MYKKEVFEFMDIITVIEREYSKLSNKQKTIADYLLQNRNKIAFLSLKELSVSAKASEVTIQIK